MENVKSSPVASCCNWLVIFISLGYFLRLYHIAFIHDQPVTVDVFRIMSDFVPFRNDNDQYSHLNNSVYNLLYDTIINKYLVEHCGLQPRPAFPTTPSLQTNHPHLPESGPSLGHNDRATPSSVPHSGVRHKSKPPTSSGHPLEAETPSHAEIELPSSPVDVLGLVVSSWSTFHRPLSFPSRLLLGMRVTKLGRSSVSYEVGVFGPLLEEPPRPGFSSPQLENESVAAVGGFTHVFVDREKRRPVKGLPRPLLEGLGAVLGSEGPVAKL
jgi:acyl-CoA thioester hydrolase